MRREVTRIVTPGTATDSALLESHENNYVAAVVSKGVRSGLAYADLSTGEFRSTELATEELIPSIETLNIREVLHVEGLPIGAGCLETPLDSWIFGADYAGRQILENFKLLSLDGCGLSDKPLATAAAGAVLHYLRDTQKSALEHLNRPAYYERTDHMVLDAATVRNLELVEPLFAGESRDATLIHILDKTCTGMGGRMLRRRLLNPACRLDEIEARLDAVAELTGKSDFARRLAQGAWPGAGSGTAAGEGDAWHGRTARDVGAGTLAGATATAGRTEVATGSGRFASRD